MKEYTKSEYIDQFGADMWQEKVANVNEGAPVDSVYATSNGNIFMIINS